MPQPKLDILPFVVVFITVDERGWHVAMGQYSSLGEGAVVTCLDAVDIGEEVLVRVQVG